MVVRTTEFLSLVVAQLTEALSSYYAHHNAGEQNVLEEERT
jgi:hypothetical protein